MRLRQMLLACTAVALLGTACSRSETAQTAAPSAAPAAPEIQVAETDVAPVGRLDDRAAPSSYRVELRIDPRQETFSGSASIDVTLTRALDTLWIHGKDLSVTSATFTPSGGAPISLSYEEVLESGVAKLAFPQSVEAGTGVLDLTYSGPFNPNLSGLYKVEVDGLAYAMTQMQDIDARRAFPSFDEPRFKVPFNFTVVAPTGDVAISNAPVLTETDLGDGWTRHVFAETRPLPTYLVAFAVGPWDLVTHAGVPPNAVRSETVPLRGLARRGEGGKFAYALDNTDGILSALETYFGTPYPYGKLDLIAAPDYAFGAMENPGAIVYLERLLLIDDTTPLTTKRLYALIHAHELAHMWFGDLVTPAWWNDIWLNESFATWMGNKATDAWAPDGEYDRETLRDALEAMDADSLASARRIREPILRNEDIITAFDGITYQKGGGVLSMFESYLGEDAFRDGVRLHMSRFEDGVATAEDFMQSLSEGSGRAEVTDAFKTFIEQPGVPLITASLDCAGAAPVVNLSQDSYRPLGSAIPADRAWRAPVCVAFTDGGERKKACTLLSEKTATLPLDVTACPTAIAPNADGAGYYRFTLDQAGWSSLIAEAPSLSPREALVLEDSLTAGFAAGAVDAVSLLAGLETLARAPEWDVATAARDSLAFYADNLLEDAQAEAALRAKIVALYKPRFAGLDAALDPAEELLAGRLLGLVAGTGRDAELRADLLARGQAYLTNGGDQAAANLPAYATNLALRMVAADGGAEGLDLLLKFIADNSDPLVRRRALGAIGSVEDPVQAARVRERLLTDPTWSGSEVGPIMYGQMGTPSVREDAWTWLKANGEEFISKLPNAFRSGAPGFAGSFCDAGRVDEVKTFFDANAALAPGYELALAQTSEQIALCAALREAKGAELAAALLP